jgi:hypothetical protein
MPNFTKPKGINFSCPNDLPAIELSRALCKTASFIQQINPYDTLYRYDDWWEHDGLHFYRESINVEKLFNLVNSPKSLLEAMQGDFNVFNGIAPKDNSWYLRFYLEWDEEDANLVGRFDITLPHSLAEQYKKEILLPLNLKMQEQESESYYQSVMSF